MKMGEESSSVSKNDGVKFGFGEEWLWAGASTAQLGWGIKAFKKGYLGDSKFMPFKAFVVASLFIGAAATASVGALKASGIHNVEDMKEAGANIRTGLGITPRNKAK